MPANVHDAQKITAISLAHLPSTYLRYVIHHVVWELRLRSNMYKKFKETKKTHTSNMYKKFKETKKTHTHTHTKGEAKYCTQKFAANARIKRYFLQNGGESKEIVVTLL